MDDNQLEKIYEELTEIYKTYITNKQTIKIKELSPNFKSYFMKQNCNLDLEINNIYIYLSSSRINIIYNLINFKMKKKSFKKMMKTKLMKKKLEKKFMHYVAHLA